MSEEELLGDELKRTGKNGEKRKELDAPDEQVDDISNITRFNNSDEAEESFQHLLSSESLSKAEYLANPVKKILCCSRKKGTIKFPALLKVSSFLIILITLIASITVTWLLKDTKEKFTSLRAELDAALTGDGLIPDSMQLSHLLLRKGDRKTKKELANIDEKLIFFEFVMRQVQGEFWDVEYQASIPPIQQKINVAVNNFKTEIMILQSTLSNIANQQSFLKKKIKRMAVDVFTINRNLEELKKLRPETPSRDDLIKLSKAALDPEIQTFNNTMFSRLKWISFDVAAAERTTNSLAEVFKNVNSMMNTTSYELKLQHLDINLLRSDIENRNRSIEAIKDLKLKFARLLKKAYNLQLLIKDFKGDSPGISLNTEMEESWATLIPIIV